MELNKEEWRDVVGYEGLYMVSNMGRVLSLRKKTNDGFMTIQKYKYGYTYVCLSLNGLSKNIKVHRLVAMAFIPNPNNKPHIDHINTTRDDNRVENLRWVDMTENMNNPLTLEKKSGANNKISKKVAIDGEIISDTALEASEILNIPYGTIRRWLNGTTSPPDEWSNRGLSYVCDENYKYDATYGKNGRARPVIIDGKIFANSIKEASEKLNVNANTLNSWLNNTYKMPQKFQDRGLMVDNKIRGDGND